MDKIKEIAEKILAQLKEKKIKKIEEDDLYMKLVKYNIEAEERELVKAILTKEGIEVTNVVSEEVVDDKEFDDIITSQCQ